MPNHIIKLKVLFLFVNSLIKFFKRKFWTAIIKTTCKKYGRDLTVNAYSRIGSNVAIGDNCNFNGMHISSGGDVFIGSNFHSGPKCKIIVQYHNYDAGKSIPYDDSVVHQTVVIEDNVWIGYHVIILGTVRIGEGAVIQAGSVVVNDIPKCAIAGGNPAKVFKMRDIEHYNKLKRLCKFY